MKPNPHRHTEQFAKGDKAVRAPSVPSGQTESGHHWRGETIKGTSPITGGPIYSGPPKPGKGPGEKPDKAPSEK